MKLVYQTIYNPFINYILRNINWSLRRVFPKLKLSPSGVIKVRLSNKESIKFKTNQTDFVAFCIFWNGLYNYEYLYIFEKLGPKLRGFVDIGSNAGIYSLIAAKVSTNIKILSFDPTVAANYYMSMNIELNDFSNKIKFFNYAISDKNEKLDFFEVKSSKYSYLKYNLGGSSSLVNYPKLFNTISVQAYSLDNFLDHNLNQQIEIDFIKIDAEGAEPNIIKGMKNTIEKFKPIIVCEILFESIGKEIEELLKSYQYEFYLNKLHNLIPAKEIKQNDSNHEIFNYFLVHPTKKYLIQEFISLK